jgi:hypothetical protein
VLPNLFVIGAAKCGTTSLHEYLDRHPEISMSREKEPDFFVPEKSRGSREWYESQFDPSAPVRGESSVSYTRYPDVADVPGRIHALIPDARFVYLVRDPIDRIVSHYLFRLLDHPEIGSLENALDTPRHGTGFLTISRYWLQLEQYLAHFDDEQILVVDADELGSNRTETLTAIFRFLGVDPEFRSETFEVRHNRTRPSQRSRIGLAMLKALYGTLGPKTAHAIASNAPEALKARFRRPIERPVVEGALRERLVAELEDDVRRLRAHTGLAFAEWSL